MIQTKVLAPIAAAVLAMALAPAPDLLSQLTAAARKNAAATRSGDEFSISKLPIVEGKEFSVSYPLRSGSSRGAGPTGYYSYADGALTFHIYPTVTIRDGSGGYVRNVNGLVVRVMKYAQGGYRGQNAFGATANVQVTKVDQDGLIFFERHEGQDIERDAPAGAPYQPFTLEHKPDRVAQGEYLARLDAEPAEARKIASDVNVAITGRFANIAGKSVFCDTSYSAATLNSPSTTYGTSCYAGASIKRIAIVRRSTGAIIKEWVKPS